MMTRQKSRKHMQQGFALVRVICGLLLLSELLLARAQGQAQAARPLVVVGAAEQMQTQDFPTPLRLMGATLGLAQNTIFTMASAPDGRVLVGTQDGLARYDGVRFESIELPTLTNQKSRSRSVRPLVHNLLRQDQWVWIGTDEAGLWYLQGEQLQHVPAPDGAVIAQINGIAAGSQGDVWVSSISGLYRCSISGCRLWLQADVSIALEGQLGSERVLWLGLEGKGVIRLPLTSVPPSAEAVRDAWLLDKSSGLPNTSTRALIQWGGPAQQDLWIGSGRGLVRVSGDTTWVWRAETHPGMMGVSCFLPRQDAEGRTTLLAGLFGGGVGSWRESGEFTRFTAKSGLQENFVYSLLQTGAAPGQLWIGTASGAVGRVEPGLWKTFDAKDGLPHPSVVGIGEVLFPDHERSHWLGTIAGSVRYQDQQWRPFLPPPWNERPIYDIAERVGGGLWLATDIGLLRWADDSFTLQNTDNSELPGLTILDFTEFTYLGKTSLWLTTRHGLATIDNDVIHKAKLPAPFAADTGARNLLYAPKIAGGSLFAATNGLYWLRSNGTAQRIDSECLSHDDVTALALRGEHELWVGGRGGLDRIRFDDERYQCHAFTSARMPSSEIFQLTLAPQGDLFAYSYNGAYRLHLGAPTGSTETNLDIVPVERFGLGDGLPQLEFNRGGLIDRAGRVWAANVGGAVMFDPTDSAVAAQATAPPFIFVAPHLGAEMNSADASATPIMLRDGAVISHAQNVGAHIAAQWRLLSYTREERIRYRAQLLGLDATPNAWSSQNNMQLQRLPPGEYQLKVWAKDAFAHEFGPISLRFKVSAPWWQQRIAIALFCTLAVALIWQWVRWRTRALKRQARALEQVVAERTAELTEANIHLEKLALTDVLTGTYNRRCFYERYCNTRFERVQAVVLLDIDHFKAINDQYGHPGGDEVLIEVAQRLKSLDAAVFRMGGEEFMLIMPVDDFKALSRYVSEVLHTIRASDMLIHECQQAVRCSVGATLYQASDDPNHHLGAAIALADQALYRAKRAGRNRAVIAMAALKQSGEDASATNWLEVL
jgi:diguanylate cyclase (GGDEF)-like protein